MKKQDITYQDKLNELRLDLLHPNNQKITFILLEGKSDVRLFRKLFNLDNCKVEVVPGGNTKVEDCVGELLNVSPLIIGIRDADFIHLEKKQYTKGNIYLTDLHDMEMMLIAEDEVFSASISEYTNITKDKHVETRERIIAVIEQISLLKWFNEKINCEYTFDAGFSDLIKYKNNEIDFAQYFTRVLSDSPNAKISDISIVYEELLTLKQLNPDSVQLCNGHDFIKALCRFIYEFGDGGSVNTENISSSFRMAYTKTMFKRTNLFSNVNTWAVANNCNIFN